MEYQSPTVYITVSKVSRCHANANMDEFARPSAFFSIPAFFVSRSLAIKSPQLNSPSPVERSHLMPWFPWSCFGPMARVALQASASPQTDSWAWPEKMATKKDCPLNLMLGKQWDPASLKFTINGCHDPWNMGGLLLLYYHCWLSGTWGLNSCLNWSWILLPLRKLNSLTVRHDVVPCIQIKLGSNWVPSGTVGVLFADHFQMQSLDSLW